MWWQGPLVGFDLETTSADPFTARIVTAAIARVGGGSQPIVETWMADPGVEIPDEAAAVHGITTERARAEGRPAREVLVEVLAALEEFLADGAPLVIYNARFDLTVLEAECIRLGVALPEILRRAFAVDPRVIDPWLDRYRRSYPRGVTPEQAKEQGIPSSRTLTGMCLHYGVALDGAHDAEFDALAACRLAYRIGQRGEVVRRVRNAQEGREKAALKREWERVRGDLALLHEFQVEEALRERARFAEYKRSIGEVEEGDRIAAEIGWPFLQQPQVSA